MGNDLQTTRDLSCVCCGAAGPSDPAHIKSRGAGGKNDGDSVIPLCRSCHVKQHLMGMCHFAFEVPAVRQALFDRGWDIVEQFGKLKLVRL